MNKTIFTIAIVIVISVTTNNLSEAQCKRCGGRVPGTGITDNVNETGIGLGVDQSSWPNTGRRQFTNGNTNVTCPRIRFESYSNPAYRAALAARDKFSPAPVYAYSRNGIDASRIDQWNRVQSQATSWDGGYNYWRWNSPTALVVPPTAAFQTSYSWGVGGTRSLPINHQFNSVTPGTGGGIGNGQSPPYWPTSTDQLGVYPVRAPWSHIR